MLNASYQAIVQEGTLHAKATLTTPLQSPGQPVTLLVMVSSSPLLSVTGTAVSTEQPLASVTVTLYRPAQRPVARLSVLNTAPPWLQLYTYGPVPPAGVAAAVPMHKLQALWVALVATASAAGSVTVNANVSLHPLASVMVTDQTPAHKLSTEAVPCPVGGAGVHA
jgi:hypothetical protein